VDTWIIALGLLIYGIIRALII